MKGDKIKISRKQFQMACDTLSCSSFTNIEYKLEVLYGDMHRNNISSWSCGPFQPKGVC